jgi:outer membrane protein OmpA-like peptidoglycan-associated protein
VGWTNPTANKSELFAGSVKSKYVAAPENMYGKQDPFDGENYAGIVAYSPRNKMPRTYLHVKLKDKLKANTLYCVRFQASLAERSRVASNNLSVLVEKSAMKSSTTGSLSNAGYITSEGNAVMSNTDDWMEFCQRFASKGGEQYITIGNFASDDKTISENREVPSEYDEVGGINAAYYYIDQVEIKELASGDNCGCASTRIPESKVIYSGTDNVKDDMTLGEKIAVMTGYFYQYNADVVSATERSVDKVIELMKQNPLLKIQVVGHTDNEEAELAKSEASLKKLGEDRAKNVVNYMQKQGIDRARLTAVSEDNKKPVSTMKTPISMAKNRRVEFKIDL